MLLVVENYAKGRELLPQWIEHRNRTTMRVGIEKAGGRVPVPMIHSVRYATSDFVLYRAQNAAGSRL